MKILILTNKLGSRGGWEQLSKSLVKEFVSQGHDVKVACCEIKDQVKGIDQRKVLGEPTHFTLCYLLAPFYALRLYRCFGKNDVDVVHSVVESYGLTAFLYSLLVRKKYFITICGSFGLKTLVRPFHRVIQRFSYQNAAGIHCISEYTKKRMNGVLPLQTYTVIPIGVFIEDNMKPISYKHRANVITSVGAMKYRKGQHVVLESLMEVRKKFPDIQYNIVGNYNDENYTDSLHSYVSEHGLGKHVSFFKKISDKDLESILDYTKVFVLTPISGTYDFEGFGLVFLEASAKGIPTVGTLDSGAEQSVKEGYSGLLVAPDNAQETASAIIELLSNEEKYKLMSENALQWAKIHTWSNVVENIIAMYNHVSINK